MWDHNTFWQQKLFCITQQHTIHPTPQSKDAETGAADFTTRLAMDLRRSLHTGKDEEDTHFSFISFLVKSDSDVLTEQDIFMDSVLVAELLDWH